MSDTITDAELLTDLRDLAAELGKTPTAQEMTDHGPHAHTKYYSQFDSWTHALELAGLTNGSRRNITEEELCTDLRRVADELGRPPTITEMDDRGQFSVSTYIRRFDSWLDARAAAGVSDTETHPTSRLSDEDLLAEIRRLAAELGRTPTTTDMDTHGRYGLRTYYTRFDGWNAACEQAGCTH